MNRKLPLRLFLLALVVGVGCLDEGYDPIGVSLNNGTFFYGCEDASDPLCDADFERVELEAIAVGGRFEMTYTPTEAGRATNVRPASEGFISTTEAFGESFVARKEGVAAVLATSGTDVIDLFHVRISTPEKVGVDVRYGAGSIDDDIDEVELPMGETLQLRAYALDDASRLLGGSLPIDWSIADDAIATLTGDTTDNVIIIEPTGVGATVATVTVDGITKDISIEVVDGGTGGSGGGGGGMGGMGGSGGNIGGSGGTGGI